MKRRIRPPKIYEDSISSISKRNNSDLENSSDKNLKGGVGKNELKTSSQHDLDIGEIDVGLKEVNDEKKKELNEVHNDKKCDDNQKLGVNGNERTDEYVKGIIDEEDNVNIDKSDELRNIKECLDKEIKNGVEESGYKNGVNGSVTKELVNDVGDILFGTVSPIDALNAEKIDNHVVNIGIKVNQKIAPNTSASRNYANVAVKEELNQNLFSIPTSVKENGEEVVIFDENIVEEGSKKWMNTLCGYFVGCNMSPPELRYNIRRMWGKFGMYDIISNRNGVWLFKFRHGEHLDTIVEQSPWKVNGIPLMVQKWNPDVCIEKAEPGKIPIWIKLSIIPLEDWSVKGISALSSRLAKPLVMDNMTASMCHNGTRRAAYTRVVIKIDEKKGYKDSIEIQYKENMIV
ncbi:RNA-directed DNA polymerase, eukaryota, reverse transcriptase zinc-binding domain protein [Tanacetum coccineum]